MKILVTGSNGLLGQHLVSLLLHKQFYVIGVGRGVNRFGFRGTDNFRYYDADISTEQPIHDIMRLEKPDVVVHAAAITQVDECELNPDRCFDTNVHGTMHLVKDAELFSRLFIFLSTDFVFSGREGNYSEEDATGPVNWYGYTKIEAENLVKDCSVPWAIVRTCLVYGKALQGTRNNIIAWVKNKLEQKEKISVIDDQWRTPTYVEDLALGVLQVIEKQATGIFHISGRDLLTPYEMAQRTADLFDLDHSLIEKVDASTFSQPAKRPARTGFVIRKAVEQLGYRPRSFREGLQKMFEE